MRPPIKTHKKGHNCRERTGKKWIAITFSVCNTSITETSKFVKRQTISIINKIFTFYYKTGCHFSYGTPIFFISN